MLGDRVRLKNKTDWKDNDYIIMTHSPFLFPAYKDLPIFEDVLLRDERNFHSH